MAIEKAGIQRVFDAGAQSYDVERRLLIPCFDAFYGNALEVIRDWGGPPRPRVVDLGAGTGLFSSLVAGVLPDAQFLLLDLSLEMLAQTSQRFDGIDGRRIQTALFDLADGDLGGPWDLVMSALAIHHLTDEQKRSLFERIYRALRPGGLFINAEQVLGPSTDTEARNMRRWHAEIRAAGATEESIARAEERMRFDRSVPVETQLQWMRDAGFADADCTFKSWRFAVLAGWKSSSGC